MPKGTCSVAGCDRAILSRTWCSVHYERWRRHGDPLWVAVFAKDLPCSADGCDRLQDQNGYCNMHDRRVKLYGSPEGRRRIKVPCIGPECTNLVGEQSTTQLCGGHYKQFTLGKPLTPLRRAIPASERPAICTYPECGRPHKSGGLCAAHVLQMRRHGELRPIRRVRPSGPCDVAGCEQVQITASYCQRHYSSRIRRWGLYGLTPEQGAALYRGQGESCAVCRTPRPIDELHIDHDHSCCPSGSQGCGNCVRGLLCSKCNNGIGYFGDDPSRLDAAAYYLRGFRGP